MNAMTELQAAARNHRDMDMLVAATYGETDEDGAFTGCSIGCLVYEKHPDLETTDGTNLHAIAAKDFGAPEWWFLLQDNIFEGLPDINHRGEWHVNCADAIAGFNLSGGDWSLALHRVHTAILRVTLKTAGSSSDVVSAVIDLHDRAGRGEVIESAAWYAAESAAGSAARYAAWSAAESAAESAAWSAAGSAARSAARYAAGSAARYAARYAAWSAARYAAWSAARYAAWSAARYAAWSAARYAAWSAAESAAGSAARSAAYIEISNAVLDALGSGDAQ